MRTVINTCTQLHTERPGGEGSFENERDNLREVTLIQSEGKALFPVLLQSHLQGQHFFCVSLRVCVYMCISVCMRVMWNNQSKEGDEQTEREREGEGGRSGSVYHWPVKAVCSDL